MIVQYISCPVVSYPNPAKRSMPDTPRSPGKQIDSCTIFLYIFMYSLDSRPPPAKMRAPPDASDLEREPIVKRAVRKRK